MSNSQSRQFLSNGSAAQEGAPPPASLLPDFVTENDVLSRFKFSRSTLRNHVLSGAFPAPVRIGVRKLWAVAEITQFAEQLMAARDRTPLEV